MTPITKICGTCGLEKPFDDFYRARNGWRKECKECSKKDSRKREANRPKRPRTKVVEIKPEPKSNPLIGPFWQTTRLPAQEVWNKRHEEAGCLPGGHREIKLFQKNRLGSFLQDG